MGDAVAPPAAQPTRDQQCAWAFAKVVLPRLTGCLHYYQWARHMNFILNKDDILSLLDIYYDIQQQGHVDKDLRIAKRVLYVCCPRFVAYVEGTPERRRQFTQMACVVTYHVETGNTPDIVSILTGADKNLWDPLMEDIREWPGGDVGLSFFDSKDTFISLKTAYVIDAFLKDTLHVRVQWSTYDDTTERDDCKVSALGPRDTRDYQSDIVLSATFPFIDPEGYESWINKNLTASKYSLTAQTFQRKDALNTTLTFAEEPEISWWYGIGLPPWIKENMNSKTYNPQELGAKTLVRPRVDSLRLKLLMHVFDIRRWRTYNRHDQRRVLHGLGLLLLDSRKVKRTLDDLDEEESTLITREKAREEATDPDLAIQGNGMRVELEQRKRPRLDQ
jgi:hypothetical protein